MEDPVITPKKITRKNPPKSASKIVDVVESSQEILNSQPSMDLGTPSASHKVQTPRSHRRRTILPPSYIQADIINETDEKSAMELERNEVKNTKNHTIHTPVVMEESNCNNQIINVPKRRRTLFTPEPMNQTEILHENRRKSILDNPKEILHTPIIKQCKTPKISGRRLQIDKTPLDNLLKTPLSISTKTPVATTSRTPLNIPYSTRKSLMNSQSVLGTPKNDVFVFGQNKATPVTTGKSLLDQYQSRITFNSAKTSGRKSLCDVSMDILEQRVKQINKRHSISQEANKSPSLLEKDSTPREKPIDLYFRQQLIKSSEKLQKSKKYSNNQEQLKEKEPLESETIKTKGTPIQTNFELTQKNPPQFKKRKLFSAESEDHENMDPKDNVVVKNKRKSTSFVNLDSSLAKYAKVGSKRRSSLDAFDLEKTAKEIVMLEKLAARKKIIPKILKQPKVKKLMFIVGTSMHTEQIQKSREVNE